jgi:ribosomal protein S18 acetylase RimI-like enzyme
MKYKIIDEKRSDEIAQLAVCLTNEIIERTGIRHFDVDVPLAIELCRNYVSNGIYQVMAAVDGDKIIGFGAICESHSLYAEGKFGIIQEFYVMPEYRSREVGRSLIEEMIRFGRVNGWKRLELCTPPVPEFNRTVEFYRSNGFEVTGGYKMKHVIK